MNFHFHSQDIEYPIHGNCTSFNKNLDFCKIYIRFYKKQGGELMSEVTETFDFMPIGQAIKKAREQSGLTREQLAEKLDITPRHLQSIENEGQHPSFQLFVQLITMFNISADQYIFSDKQTDKTSLRRQVDALLDAFTDKELTVIEGTAQGICKAKEPEE
jgi:transcriptional regulator with XRE-family HTH domain